MNRHARGGPIAGEAPHRDAGRADDHARVALPALTPPQRLGARGVTPVVRIDGGVIRGLAASGARHSSGCRMPRPRPGTCAGGRRAAGPLAGRPRRDGQFAPSCPQPPSLFVPPGPFSEDCLYLNVYTPALRRRGGPPGARVDPRRRLH